MMNKDVSSAVDIASLLSRAFYQCVGGTWIKQCGRTIYTWRIMTIENPAYSDLLGGWLATAFVAVPSEKMVAVWSICAYDTNGDLVSGFQSEGKWSRVKEVRDIYHVEEYFDIKSTFNEITYYMESAPELPEGLR